jgi:hypothetical protein
MLTGIDGAIAAETRGKCVTPHACPLELARWCPRAEDDVIRR